MTTQLKTITSLSALLLLGLSATCNAEADSSRYEKRTNAEVKYCVAEIAKRADYTDATRVVHWVHDLRQRNLVEVEIEITTSVYFDGKNKDPLAYETSCVIAALGDIVDVQFEAASAEQLVSASR